MYSPLVHLHPIIFCCWQFFLSQSQIRAFTQAGGLGHHWYIHMNELYRRKGNSSILSVLKRKLACLRLFFYTHIKWMVIFFMLFTQKENKTDHHTTRIIVNIIMKIADDLGKSALLYNITSAAVVLPPVHSPHDAFQIHGSCYCAK